MKASEVIEKIQKKIELHGDKEIRFYYFNHDFREEKWCKDFWIDVENDAKTLKKRGVETDSCFLIGAKAEEIF